MRRLLYDVAFTGFSAFYLPIFWMKGKHRDGAGERFGKLSQDVLAKARGKKVYWVHAVSVGEVALAMRLMGHWREKFPGAHLHLTVTTMAGHEVAKKNLHADDTLSYFPVDFRGSVKRFIDTLKPSALVILETEIWPNLIHELAARSIPVYIVNGRISDRALPKYLAAKFFLKPVLAKLSGIGAYRMRR